MALTGRHGWSRHLVSFVLVSFLGVTMLTSGVNSGHHDDELSVQHRHHHQQQHHLQPRNYNLNNNHRLQSQQSNQHHYNRHDHHHHHRLNRRRRHQKDHHQHRRGECSNVATFFNERMEDIRLKTGNNLDISDKKFQASNQSICYFEISDGPLDTCCRLHDEPTLEKISAMELQEMVASLMIDLKVTIKEIVTSYEASLAKLFDKLSSKLVQLLAHDLHLPFKHVNSTVTHLLDHLHVYMTPQENMDLPRIVERFFDSVFALSYYYILHEPVNEISDPDPGHSSCVLSVKDLYPGRSFLLAKFRSSLGFIKTLRSMFISTRDIVDMASNVDLDEHCVRRLAELNYCPKCSGFTTAQPCPSLCMNVYTGCLSNYIDLDFQWRDFILVLHKLTTMTKNNALLMELFPRKMEEALVYYHLEADLMYSMVSNHCGPHNDTNWTKRNFNGLKEIGILRRQQMNSSSSSSGHGFNSNMGSSESVYLDMNNNEDSEDGTFLSKLEKSVKDVEFMWPFNTVKFCEDGTKRDDGIPEEQIECWNGSSVGRYSKSSYKNSKFETVDIIISKSPNAEFISELLENNSMIIFKKTMGSTLPLLERHFDTFDSSGDYEGFYSGSDETWEDEFSGMSGDYTDEDLTASPDDTTELTTHSDDFEFTDTTPHRHPPPPSPSTSPPTIPPGVTTPPGKTSSGVRKSVPSNYLLVLTSLVIAYLFSGASTLFRLPVTSSRRGCHDILRWTHVVPAS